MKNKLLLTVTLLTWTLNIHAQVSQQWATIYNGTGNNTDDITAMVVDTSGNVYVTGKSTPAPIGYGVDIVTIKYNSAGVQQWLASYNGTFNNNDFVNAIAIDVSGNVYVTGQTNNGTNNYDIVTIKYNSAGIQQWASTYNGAGSGPDNGLAIAVGTSGDVYVTGMDGSGSGGNGTITIKYNSSGIQQWATLLPLGGYGTSIAVDGTGNVYVATTSSGGDVAAIKYNNAGVQQWLSTYSSPSSNQDYGKSLKLDASGNVYVLGGVVNSSKDIVTIKYDNAGVQQWATIYTNDDDSPKSLNIDNSGNIYVAGDIYKINSTFDFDGVTIKYNSSGVQQWANVYNSAGNNTDQLYAITSDNSGNVYVTGYETTPSFDMDIITIKYNSTGAQQWLTKYASTGGYSDGSNAIGLDGSNNVYVAGYTGTAVASGVDYIVVKYSQGGISVFEETSADNSVIIYPNPSAGVFNFAFAGELKRSEIEIYNALGEKITIAATGMSGNFQIDLSSQPNGIYFIKLKTSSGTAAQKLIINK